MRTLTLHEGDTCEARARGRAKWCRGVVDRINGRAPRATYDVRYDDGRRERDVRAEHVRCLLRVGDRIEADCRGKGRWYDGTVEWVDHESGACHIRYADGDYEEWVRSDSIRPAAVGAARSPSSSSPSASATTPSAARSGASDAFREGQEVDANYMGQGPMSRARVVGVHPGNRYDVEYDDFSLAPEYHKRGSQLRVLSGGAGAAAASPGAAGNVVDVRGGSVAEGEMAEYADRAGIWQKGLVRATHRDGAVEMSDRDGRRVRGRIPRARVRPHREQFREGHRVEARFRGDPTAWHRGLVERVHPDRTFDVAFDDGDFESRVRAQDIRVEALVASRQPEGGVPLFRVGDPVEAQLGDALGPGYGTSSGWTEGTVDRVHSAGELVDVRCVDGYVQVDVDVDCVRPLVRRAPSAFPPGSEVHAILGSRPHNWYPATVVLESSGTWGVTFRGGEHEPGVSRDRIRAVPRLGDAVRTVADLRQGTVRRIYPADPAGRTDVVLRGRVETLLAQDYEIVSRGVDVLGASSPESTAVGLGALAANASGHNGSGHARSPRMTGTPAVALDNFRLDLERAFRRHSTFRDTVCVFRLVDADSDGCVTMSELIGALRALGASPAPADLRLLFDRHAHDGRVDYLRLLEWVHAADRAGTFARRAQTCPPAWPSTALTLQLPLQLATFQHHTTVFRGFDENRVDFGLPPDELGGDVASHVQIPSRAGEQEGGPAERLRSALRRAAWDSVAQVLDLVRLFRRLAGGPRHDVAIPWRAFIQAARRICGAGLDLSSAEVGVLFKHRAFGFDAARAGRDDSGAALSLKAFLRFTLLDSTGLRRAELVLKTFIRRRRVHARSFCRITAADAFEWIADPGGELFRFERAARRRARDSGARRHATKTAGRPGSDADDEAFREYTLLVAEQQRAPRSPSALSDDEDANSFGEMVVRAEPLARALGRLGCFVTLREAEALIGRWTKSLVTKSASNVWVLDFSAWRRLWRDRARVDEERWHRSLRVWWGPEAPAGGAAQLRRGESAVGQVSSVGAWLDRVSSHTERRNYGKFMRMLEQFEREAGLAESSGVGLAAATEDSELTIALGAMLKCSIRFHV